MTPEPWRLGGEDMGRGDGPSPAIAIRLLLLLYLALGVLYATHTPAWQAPDEPAHYNYVRFVAENARLPELRPGDYDQAYLEAIKARRFPAEMSIEPIRYEFHQPPLYYLAAAVVYRLAHLLGLPTLLTLRLFSLLLGAGALLFGYRLVRRLFPGEPSLALGTTAFAAFLPMHLAMTAAVNNDVLAELWLNFTALKVVGMEAASWSKRRALALGALLGLALLTKLQSYTAVALVLAALIWDAWPRRGQPRALPWRQAVERAGLVLGTCLALVSPWLVQNVLRYGLHDPLGLARHDQVVQGQLTTAQYIAQNGWGALLRNGALTTFRSFWGQFGWMGVLLDERIYLALALVSGLAVVGFALSLEHLRREPLPPRTQRGLVLLLLWALLTTLGYLWWNTKYLQHQGRYLFPALVPWGLAFTLGLRELLRRSWRLTLLLVVLGAVALVVAGLITGDLKGLTLALLVGLGMALAVGQWLERRQPGAALAFFYAALAALAAVCLYGYIVPALA